MTKQYKSYWKVPSSTKKGMFYTVVADPDGTACTCLMRSHGEGKYPCWHEVLVRVLTSPMATARLCTKHALREARSGDLESQIQIFAAAVVFALHNPSEWGWFDTVIGGVTHYAEALHKYVKALAVHAENSIHDAAIRRMYVSEAKRDGFVGVLV
jgi:hypothetical protein